MASPKTIQLKADAAARSTARWVEIHAAYAESHPSLPLYLSHLPDALRRQMMGF